MPGAGFAFSSDAPNLLPVGEHAMLGFRARFDGELDAVAAVGLRTIKRRVRFTKQRVRANSPRAG